MGKKETYKQAMARLLTEAKAAGYKVQTKSSKAPWNDLKRPRIFRKDERRGYEKDAIEFSPQAVQDMATGHSLYFDPRGMSFKEFAERAKL